MWMPRVQVPWLPWEPGTSRNGVDVRCPQTSPLRHTVISQSKKELDTSPTCALLQATLCRQHYSSSFHTHNAVISLFPLPQSLSGKMLLVSFDGKSATQVKSLVLFLSFVVTTTSEFNSAACFSTAVFAWKNTKELSTFLTYILLSRAYNLAEKMLTAEDQHSKSQCGGSISFQLWEGKQYVIFITINRKLLWGFYFLDFFSCSKTSSCFELSNWMY